MGRKWIWLSALVLLLFGRECAAFCGFYVSGADAALTARASIVVLMRDGTTTVLSMQNSYEGPPQDFAVVVPVPVVLQKENVRTLPRALFSKVDQLAGPRLVEYWEQDPCQSPAPHVRRGMSFAPGAAAGVGRAEGAAAPPPAVKIEAEFDVDEYQIVILSSTDAAALDTWLRDNGYKIPPGADKHLRPYVESGMKFFVAKVDPKKITFKDGRAMLSPLRVHYDDAQFRLPVRLGLINATDAQDLVIHILAKNTRFEVANRPNVPIPTNLNVRDDVRKGFGSFYASLFDQTLEKHPGAVVTEYAWASSSCDPCPGPVLSPEDLKTLGADVVPERARRVFLRHIEPEKEHSAFSGVIYGKGNALSDCASGVTPLPAIGATVDLTLKTDAEGKIVSALSSPGATPDSSGLTACFAETLIGLALNPQARPLGSDPSSTVASLAREVRVTLQVQQDMSSAGNWVLTRLHARYKPDTLGDDLVFRTAAGIAGGREWGGRRPNPGGEGALSETAEPSPMNMFQARYAIRHPWTGPIACAEPVRGRWGGPPKGTWPSTEVARDLAFAKRGVALAGFIAGKVPSFAEMPALGQAPPDPTSPRPSAVPPRIWPPPSASSEPAASASSAAPTGTSGGCACSLSDDEQAPSPWALLGLGLCCAAVVVRRQRR